MAEVGSAFVSVLPSARGFGKKLDSEVGPQLDKSGKSGSKRFGGALSSGLKSALAPGLAILGTVGVGAFLKGAVAEAREAQKVGALTNNVIRTTGGVANVTAKQVGQLATAISNKTGIDDEAIQSGSNLLLTFKNVRNEVGAGAKIFDRATQAAVDLSAAGFGDLSGTSKQLGKALNDPIKGISALGRAGVTFTAGQKKQIAGFVAANDLLSAQKIILKEVESQVGGSAAATATAGDKMSVAFGNLQETVGTALLPAIDKFSVVITNDVIPAVSKFVTGMQDGTGAGGRVADTLGNIYSAAKPVAVVIGQVASAFGGLSSGTQTLTLLGIAAIALAPKLNAMGSSANSAVLNLRTMPDAQRNAAVQAGALRVGAGGAAVALGALAAKSGGASTGLGALATVGAGVAAGFAVGGPWGAAIGGGAGLLSVFSAKSSTAAATQARLRTEASAVSVTLNEQTGAITNLTRTTVAKTLADNGAFTSARKLGVSYEDVLQAALGNEAATKRVTRANLTWAESQPKTIAGVTKIAKVTDSLSGVINRSSSSIANQRDKINQVNEAMGRGKNKTVNYTVKTPGLTGALVGLSSLGAAIQRAIDKQGKLKNVGSNAKGTDNWRGGMTLVGEEGPELINLAKGAQVIPAPETRRALSSGLSTSLSASGNAGVNLTINPQPGQSETEIGRAAANRLLWVMS